MTMLAAITARPWRLSRELDRLEHCTDGYMHSTHRRGRTRRSPSPKTASARSTGGRRSCTTPGSAPHSNAQCRSHWRSIPGRPSSATGISIRSMSSSTVIRRRSSIGPTQVSAMPWGRCAHRALVTGCGCRDGGARAPFGVARGRTRALPDVPAQLSPDCAVRPGAIPPLDHDPPAARLDPSARVACGSGGKCVRTSPDPRGPRTLAQAALRPSRHPAPVAGADGSPAP